MGALRTGVVSGAAHVRSVPVRNQRFLWIALIADDTG
jgi:hypothetical protein